MEFLLGLDQRLFLLINGWHAPWADALFALLTGRWVWIPFYLWLLRCLWIDQPKRLAALLVATALLVVFTDQSSRLAKAGFKRNRPCHSVELADRVRTPENRCGGAFGFFSSHAANTAGIAAWLGVLFWPRRKKLVAALLVYACANAYARVYLGYHYPGDVLVGMLVGAGWAGLLLRAWKRWSSKFYAPA
jgi:undecaprenyl-diphosphatase